MPKSRKRLADPDEDVTSSPTSGVHPKRVTTEKRVKKKAKTSAKKKMRKSEAEENDDDDDDDGKITGDTIMGFPKYPKTTNRDIVLKHSDFVRWARKQAKPFGRLKQFMEWINNSKEGKKLELKGRGKERFTYGRHKGTTFAEIAKLDPDYRIVYLRVLRERKEEPNGVTTRYVDWFQEKYPSQTDRSSNSRGGKGGISGKERFNFGRHKGRRFSQVANGDPAYHLRYLSRIADPYPQMARYIKYYKQHDPGESVAHQAHTDHLASYSAPYACW